MLMKLVCGRNCRVAHKGSDAASSAPCRSVFNPLLHFTQLTKVKANRHVFQLDLDFELNSIIGTVPGDVASPAKTSLINDGLDSRRWIRNCFVRSDRFSTRSSFPYISTSVTSGDKVLWRQLRFTKSPRLRQINGRARAFNRSMNSISQMQ